MLIPNLQTIFISIQYQDLELLNPILETYEVPQSEKDTVKKFIQKCNEVNYIPSKEMITSLLNIYFNEDHEPVTNIKEYIDQYIRYYKNFDVANKLLSLSREVLENGINENIVSQLEDLTKTDTAQTDIELLSTDKYMEVYKGDNIEKSTISTCVRQLDEQIGGIQKGKLTSILGWTGSFKTTMALNISYAAQVQGLNTLYLSLEVSKYDVQSNLLSRHSNQKKFTTQIEHLDLKQHKLSEQDLQYLEDTIIPDYNQLTGKIYIIDDTDIGSYSQYSLEQAFTQINNTAIKETGRGIDICVVDHINLLKFGESKLGTTDAVNKYTTFFRQQAVNWCKTKQPVAMIVLAQSNREGGEYARKHGGNYLLGHFAEGNELERASSLVLTTYSDDGLKALSTAKVGLIKNRDGAPIEFAFETVIEPEYYTFGNTIVNDNLDTTEFTAPSLSEVIQVEGYDFSEFGL